MKVIALYLPQFHETKENNEWWGQGYTEWMNCKKAISLCKGNYQPRVPLDNNYYDLLDLSVQRWQTKLAKQYGIYGFCYYHYWFEGHRILDKPMENMLNDKANDMPFCVSWANHSWASNPQKGKGKVFIKQTYGDTKDWINHFEYLLPFFKDKRYILKDNKPIFIVHNVSDIPCWLEMKKVWNGLAIKNGFDGMFFINTLKSIDDVDVSIRNDFDAQFEFQPTMAMNNDIIHRYIWKGKRLLYRDYLDRPAVFSYSNVWKQLLKTDYRKCPVTTYLGAYTDWDNTARWGRIGNFHKGASPVLFEKYFANLCDKAKQMNNSEFIFINAWNEWGEGAYLEPDMKYEYGYLEAIKSVLGEELL